MLPVNNRLKNRVELNRVFKEGKVVGSGFLLLKYRRSNGTCSRVAFSIGLKFSKKATIRNRAKRLLRELIRSHLYKIKPGYELVFFFKGSAPEPMNKQTFEPLIIAVLQKAKLINI